MGYRFSRKHLADRRRRMAYRSIDGVRWIVWRQAPICLLNEQSAESVPTALYAALAVQCLPEQAVREVLVRALWSYLWG